MVDVNLFLYFIGERGDFVSIFYHYPSSHIIRDGQVFKGAELEHHTGVEETVHTL